MHWSVGFTQSVEIIGMRMRNGDTELSEFTLVDLVGKGTLVRLRRNDRVVVSVIVVEKASSEVQSSGIVIIVIGSVNSGISTGSCSTLERGLGELRVRHVNVIVIVINVILGRGHVNISSIRRWRRSGIRRRRWGSSGGQVDCVISGCVGSFVSSEGGIRGGRRGERTMFIKEIKSGSVDRIQTRAVDSVGGPIESRIAEEG